MAPINLPTPEQRLRIDQLMDQKQKLSQHLDAISKELRELILNTPKKI